MYQLDASYGKRAYDEWHRTKSPDLRGSRTSWEEADEDFWEVNSFRSLLECVAFLNSMNGRMVLFYRGQTNPYDPLPMIFRSKWRCFDTDYVLDISASNRPNYWMELDRIGKEVFNICQATDVGLPRQYGLRRVREVQWAVIQHYELWPTPLIDLTSSLHVAASFGMDHQFGKLESPRTSYLYVVGMPHSTGSISFDVDTMLALARLQSACPPVARRPHFQDGFLVGRFPLADMSHRYIRQSRLARRLVAKFKLVDNGDFWQGGFQMVAREALLPVDDPLLERFNAEFGEHGAGSLYQRAKRLG